MLLHQSELVILPVICHPVCHRSAPPSLSLSSSHSLIICHSLTVIGWRLRPPRQADQSNSGLASTLWPSSLHPLRSLLISTPSPSPTGTPMRMPVPSSSRKRTRLTQVRWDAVSASVPILMWTQTSTHSLQPRTATQSPSSVMAQLQVHHTSSVVKTAVCTHSSGSSGQCPAMSTAGVSWSCPGNFGRLATSQCASIHSNISPAPPQRQRYRPAPVRLRHPLRLVAHQHLRPPHLFSR